VTGCGRLPVVYAPEVDERLSSWAARMAPFYAMTVSEFVAALGLKGHDVFDLEWRLSEGQGALIAARTGLLPEAVQAMTFRELGSAARMMIVRKNRSPCPHCSEDLHRKAAAQPRMSLQTRRDYHEFLNTPILRQALTVVVPEYDQVAPVLAKPVRPGLHALAQGSLLQAFALTVGIGRVTEDPVKWAISIKLMSDAEGQGRVREALRSWPLSLRRRISARFWRAERDESARQSAEKAARQRQSHKYRTIQSHKYRYRIS
jgi:hypothetical protein